MFHICKMLHLIFQWLDFSTNFHSDAERGNLQYRQYAIEDLFGKTRFAENISLLVFGSLPDDKKKRCLDRKFAQSMLEHLAALPCIRSFPYVKIHAKVFLKTKPSNRRDAPMMTMIMGGISACAALKPSLIPVHEDHDIYGSNAFNDEHIIRTISTLAVVVCGSYCHLHSLTFRKPRMDLGFVENMLYMMSFSPGTSSTPGAQQVRQLEDLLMLHSEHGTCNATVAFLHVASTRADPLSCLLAALAAIYGPLHGGSNMVTYHQLQKIGSVQNVSRTIEEVKSRKRRLYGFGHRIYRAIDPRAALLKQFLQRHTLGVQDPLLRVALHLEHVVDTDPFFTTKNLKANTDLYTVLAYKAM